MLSCLTKMSQELLIPSENLRYIIKTCPFRYKKYYIPKKGGQSRRLIAHPAKEVKSLQRWIVANIISKYPVSDAAKAYRKGIGIYHNAVEHVNSKFLLKLDFRNFFLSIKRSDVENFFRNGALELGEDDIISLSLILTWSMLRRKEPVVAIGAPSSPALTNSMLYDFDVYFSSWCSDRNIVYTRYADDLSFSGDDKSAVLQAKSEVYIYLKSMHSPRLTINERKTVFVTRPFRRFVTGLYLTNDGSVSLGREKKRQIRSQVYHYRNGDLSDVEIKKLKGMISFSRSVEPGFVDRLESKYGQLFRT